ncbi:pentapeptide repeat-containing protein [Rhodococcus sp. NPDC019627]|uniref:pentapeptide repeat-containing protein n=1 Tax=unclassified Rhodococcus (in: high G+C Gram-positive bacteria) TaxID=192944 RepID=UPI0033CA60A5
MEDESSPPTPAERRLLEAIRNDELCDFSDGAPIAIEEMPHWGGDRTVSADLFRRLLLNAYPGIEVEQVRLRGAVISGLLELRFGQIPPVKLEHCRLDGVEFGGATFTGDAEFGGAQFTGRAGFRGATFTGGAGFDKATFAGGAQFYGVTFAGDAWFYGVTFAGDAEFVQAMFTRAGFDGATFTGDAEFLDATFTGEAEFRKSKFAGDAAFQGATFTGDVLFNEAAFTSGAGFYGALAKSWNLSLAQFLSLDPGPWIGSEVILVGASFHVRSRVVITASTTDCSRLQAREGAHLLIRSREVDLSDAEFLRRSILAGPGAVSASPTRIASRLDPGGRPHEWDQLSEIQRAPWQVRKSVFEFARQLATDLDEDHVPGCSVMSLSRANVGNLVISGIALGECSFAGAHELDKMRIDEKCSFGWTPEWSWRRPFTRRRVIVEEIRWRQVHTKGWGEAGPSEELLPALEIAGIYRDLRKGLEDAKNEPGAADFYYGEMEMRRLAGREPVHTRDRTSPWVERALLYAYWALSGYGLRASRALAALALVLIGSAVLFTHSTFAALTPLAERIVAVDLATGSVTHARPEATTESPSFITALEFSARESLSLLQTRSTATLTTTPLGTLLDFLVRLLGPLLLALAAFAVRGRTKR